MASIVREIGIAASADAVWDAARDYGALHTRLAPESVTHTAMEPGADPPVRVVTFADGRVLREAIIGVDDVRRRLVWAIQGGPVTHHNGALQVISAPAGGCRAVWTADVLPNALAEPFAAMMERGLAGIKRHLEGGAATLSGPAF